MKSLLLALLCLFSVQAYATGQASWVSQHQSSSNMVWGGYEPGRALGVCHTKYAGGTHPGKLIDGQTCNIGYGGKEIVQTEYQVLNIKGFYNWAFAQDGNLPPYTISGGEENGQSLYVCRTMVNGTLHPGKIVGGNCSVGYGGKEIMNNQYEVLTLPPY